GMDDALGDTLAVEVGHLLDQVTILQEDRATRAGGEGMLIARRGDTGVVGRDGPWLLVPVLVIAHVFLLLFFWLSRLAGMSRRSYRAGMSRRSQAWTCGCSAPTVVLLVALLPPFCRAAHRMPPCSGVLVVHVSHATAGASQGRLHERLHRGRSCAGPAPTPPAARHSPRSIRSSRPLGLQPERLGE